MAKLLFVSRLNGNPPRFVPDSPAPPSKINALDIGAWHRFSQSLEAA
jgi:hypothetical protein